MKPTKLLPATCALLLLALFSAAAQPLTNVTPGQVSGGQIVVPDRPTAPDSSFAGAVDLRPKTSARPELPPAVSARISRFKLDARTYLAQQEALKKKMAGASEQERAALRDRLRELREEWLAQAREKRQEYKDRKVELEQKLKEHKELFNDLRDKSKEQLRDRRGTDSRRGIE